MTAGKETLCESLRRQADRLHGKGHKCPSPPCPFEEEAAELRAAADEIKRLREGLRWIAAGKTGSYGTPQAFAVAVLEDEDE